MIFALAAAGFIVVLLLYLAVRKSLQPGSDESVVPDVCNRIETRDDQPEKYYIVKNRFGSVKADPPVEPETEPDPEPEPEGTFIAANDLKGAEPISVEEFRKRFAVQYGMHYKLPRPMREYPNTPIGDIREGQRGFISIDDLACQADGTLVALPKAIIRNEPGEVAIERSGEELIVTILDHHRILVADSVPEGAKAIYRIFVVNEMPPDNNINNW